MGGIGLTFCGARKHYILLNGVIVLLQYWFIICEEVTLRCGLVASALGHGASSLGWSPGWGHSVVFLGKTHLILTVISLPTSINR